MKKILLLLLIVISFSVQATDTDKFCIKNDIKNSAYNALFPKVSIGIKIFYNGYTVAESKDGKPIRINCGEGYCLNTIIGDIISVYRKSGTEDWTYKYSYPAYLLGGTDLIIKNSGWFGAEDYALKYTPNQKNDYQPASWMSQLFAKNPDIRLRDVCIPGTHASGSYQPHKSKTLDPSMSQEWRTWEKQFDNSIAKISYYVTTVGLKEKLFYWLTRTQSVPVSKQLSLGARYLEMKIVPHKEDFFTARGGLLGQPVDIILADVKDFIRKNPSEIILLHFSDTSALNQHDHRRLFEKVSATLENLLISADYGTDITAGEIYQTPGRVIVFYQSDLYKIPGSLCSNQKKVKQFGVEIEDAHLLLKEISKMYRCSISSLFEITNMHLTPSMADFYYNTMFMESYSRDLADRLKYPSGIAQLFSKAAQQYGRRLNIVSHDYIESSDLFDSCMAINQDLLEDVFYDIEKGRAESMQQNRSETEQLLSESDETTEEKSDASSEEQKEIFSEETTSILMEHHNLCKRRIR